MLDKKITTFRIKLMSIRDKVVEIKNLGIDTSTYEQELKEISEEVENSINRSIVPLKNKEREKLVDDKITKLENINKTITEKYSTYYQISNNCTVLEQELNNINYSNADEIINKIKIFALDVMENLSLGLNDDDNNLIEKAYLLIYKAMKYELLFCKEHLLFEVMKENETGSFFISELIKKDLEKVSDNTEVEFLIDIAGKDGLGNIKYINKPLMTKLIKLVNPEVYNTALDEIDRVNEKYIKGIEEIEEWKLSIKESEENISNLKKDKRKITRMKLLNIGIVSLFATLIIQGEVKLYRFATDQNSKMRYKTVIETFDDSKTEDEQYTSSTEYIEMNPKAEYVTIKVTSPSEGKYTTYKVLGDEDNYEDLSDYINIDNNKLCVIDTESIKKEKDKEDTYLVTKYTQDLSDCRLTINKLGTYGIMIIFNICLLWMINIESSAFYDLYAYDLLSKRRDKKERIEKSLNKSIGYLEEKKEKLNDAILALKQIIDEHNRCYEIAHNNNLKEIEKKAVKVLKLEEK